MRPLGLVCAEETPRAAQVIGMMWGLVISLYHSVLPLPLLLPPPPLLLLPLLLLPLGPSVR